MSKEIIEQVKDAEIKMGQLSQTMKKEKQGLQDKMTQEKEAFKAHLDQQLQAHKTALTEQYEEKLQTFINLGAFLKLRQALIQEPGSGRALLLSSVKSQVSA